MLESTKEKALKTNIINSMKNFKEGLTSIKIIATLEELGTD